MRAHRLFNVRRMEGKLDFSLEFQAASRDCSRITTVAGLEGYIFAVHFSVFDGRWTFAPAEEAAPALNRARKAAALLVQCKDHRSVAHQKGHHPRGAPL